MPWLATSVCRGGLGARVPGDRFQAMIYSRLMGSAFAPSHLRGLDSDGHCLGEGGGLHRGQNAQL